MKHIFLFTKICQTNSSYILGYNDYKPSYNNGRGGGGFRPNNNYRDDRRSNEFRSNGDQSGGGSYGRKDYGDRADEDSTSGAYQRDFNRGSYRDNRVNTVID